MRDSWSQQCTGDVSRQLRRCHEISADRADVESLVEWSPVRTLISTLCVHLDDMCSRVATGGAAEESANIVGKAGSAESAMFMLISLDILV